MAHHARIQQLNDEAYIAVMKVLSKAPLDWEKQKLLKKLEGMLHIDPTKSEQIVEDVMCGKYDNWLPGSSIPAGSAAADAGLAAAGAGSGKKMVSAGPGGRMAVHASSNNGGLAPDQSGSPARSHKGLQPEQLVGMKCARYWHEEGGWCEGVILDYQAAKGTHIIVYDYGTSKATQEEYRIIGAPSSEFRLRNGRVNVMRGGGGGGGPRGSKAQQQQQQQQQTASMMDGWNGDFGTGDHSYGDAAWPSF